MRNRTLSLKRESLSELTSGELVVVAGGQALTHATCGVTDACTHGISFDRCPTLPINDCTRLFEVGSLDCPTK